MKNILILIAFLMAAGVSAQNFSVIDPEEHPEIYEQRKQRENQVAKEKMMYDANGVIMGMQHSIQGPTKFYDNDDYKKFMEDPLAPINAATAMMNECGNISFNAADVTRCAPIGSFNLIPNGLADSPEALAAFQYALDIWSRALKLDVPVTVNADFGPLGPGILGGASGNVIIGAASPIPNVWYPSALYDQFAGSDVFGTDINITFSSTFDWYFGLDGCPGPGQFDFVTVVLHELGHGLGFFGSEFVLQDLFAPGVGLGCFGFSFDGVTWYPYIYDTFLFNTAFGIDLSIFDPTFCVTGLDQFWTNNSLVFTGPNTVACNGGPAPIYSPTTYSGGSSGSHFDEATYAGVHPNSLLTPFIAPGTAVHDPECTLAVFSDLGYSARSEVAQCPVPVPTMGEWGIMSLGLLLLILGVVTIKSRKLVFG